jgi:hypothetical protein
MPVTCRTAHQFHSIAAKTSSYDFAKEHTTEQNAAEQITNL